MEKKLVSALITIVLIILAALGWIKLPSINDPRSKNDVYELSGSESHFFKGMPKLTGPRIPLSRGKTTTIVRKAYALEHSANWKTSVWVCEHLTAKQLKGDIEREDAFGPDPKLVKGQRAETKDYARSGYDRGHLAPAGDFTIDPALKEETFFLSNMAPQVPEFNRGIWKSIEGYTRKLAEKHGEIWIVTGCLFFEESEESGRGNNRISIKRIGPGKVAVPSHFYKIIIRRTSSGPKALTFVVRNKDYDPPFRFDKLVKSVDWVESWAGLDIMPELVGADEAAVEARPASVSWTKKSGFQWDE